MVGISSPEDCLKKGIQFAVKNYEELEKKGKPSILITLFKNGAPETLEVVVTKDDKIVERYPICIGLDPEVLESIKKADKEEPEECEP